MPEPKYSERDSRGMLYVACCECQRGGNGDADCSSGWNIKKGGYAGCFAGSLLSEFTADESQPEAQCKECSTEE